MNKFEQFKDLVQSKIEDPTVKEEIILALASVKGVFDENIVSRDKAKEKLKETSIQNELFKQTLGIRDDESIDKQIILSKIESNDNADELETKYKGDIELLRSKLQEQQDSNAINLKKYEDTLFDNTIIHSNLLKDFIDEPLAKHMITERVKAQLLMVDGKMFAKDVGTGKVATDLITGLPLTAENVIDNLKKDISPMYLKPKLVSPGGGANTPMGSDNANQDFIP